VSNDISVYYCIRYTDLVGSIPMDMQSQWYYAKILQKLQNFGLVSIYLYGQSADILLLMINHSKIE